MPDNLEIGEKDNGGMVVRALTVANVAHDFKWGGVQIQPLDPTEEDVSLLIDRIDAMNLIRWLQEWLQEAG
jgi:hypothetical protein